MTKRWTWPIRVYAVLLLPVLLLGAAGIDAQDEDEEAWAIFLAWGIGILIIVIAFAYTSDETTDPD